MSRVYKEANGRYTYKTTEVYKGIKFECKCSSRKSKTEAKQNWQKNLESRKCKINHIDSQTDPSNPLKKALPEWYELYHERSWRNERTKRTDHDTIKQICKSMLGEFPVMLISSDHIQKYFISESEKLSKSSLKKRRNIPHISTKQTIVCFGIEIIASCRC